MQINKLVTPVAATLGPVALSLGAWLVPGESLSLRGFQFRSELGVGGLLILLGWYTSVLAAVLLGIRVGKRIKPPRILDLPDDSEHAFDRVFLLTVTVMALVGTVAAYYQVSRTLSIGAVLGAQSGNALAASLTESAGLQSLRYAAILAAALSLHQWTQYRRGTPLLLLNGMLLLAAALLSSRLSIVVSAIVFAYLVAKTRPDTPIRLRRLLPIGIGLYGLLAFFNYVRNANFYRFNGVDNPLAMNNYQVLSYLGAPFQVSAGVAESVADGSFGRFGSFGEASQLLVPTFLRAESAGSTINVQGSARYSNTVDVSGNLTANSVFADTLTAFGWAGLILALVGFFASGVLFGHFSMYPFSASAGAGIMLYTFCELWRTFILTQGVVVLLTLSALAAAWIAGGLVSAGLPRKRPVRAGALGSQRRTAPRL